MIRVHARLSSGRRLDKLQDDVLGAMHEALQTANPARIIRRHVRLDHDTLRVDKLSFPLKRDQRLFVFGAGKASGYMAEEIERILGERIDDGFVIIPDYLRPRPRGHRIRYHLGTHPIPSRKNTDGAAQILRLVKNSTANDLIVVILSGGASALMDYPLEGISLEDKLVAPQIWNKHPRDQHSSETHFAGERRTTGRGSPWCTGPNAHHL